MGGVGKQEEESNQGSEKAKRLQVTDRGNGCRRGE